MKKIISLVYICVCCFTLAFSHESSNTFYYGFGEKNELTIVANKLALQKQSDISKKDFLQNLSLASDNYSIEWRGENICVVEDLKSSNISSLKDKILQRKENIELLSIYTINKYTEAIMFHEILVQWKTSAIDESLVAKYGLILKSDKRRYQIYTLPAGSDVVKIANQLYETGACIFSYPHFHVPVQPTAYIPNDTYFQYQIACHNTGQSLPNGHTGTNDADIDAPNAWDITTGDPSIIIAVFDQGVTSNHPDLPNIRQVRLNGSNFGSGDPNDPSPTGNENHGNACAGVIAATMDNNEGIAGIAPNCKIMPLRWDGSSTDSDMADGIYFAVDSGANILSCSWGYTGQNYSSPIISTAISYAIAHNVVVLFAAGNTANHSIAYNGFVTFPANANISNLITVGASDRYDNMANYSPKSSLIDFVAPSHRAYPSQISGETLEMWSLDIPGFAGYNPIPSEMSSYAPEGTMLPSTGTHRLAYTGYFGGTSHSCPVVAGVVALMLSVNPFLTPTEVYDVLRETCDKVGGYTYTSGRCDQMGYGRINAYEAVAEARDRHPIQGSDFVCDTTCFYLVDAPSNAAFNWSLQQPPAYMGYYSIIQGQGTSNVCLRHILPSPPIIPIRTEFTDSTEYGNRDIPTNLTGSISITVTTPDTTYTISRKLRMPKRNTPEVSVSDTAYMWPHNQTRTFTVTNNINEPDSIFLWEVRRRNTLITTYRGRVFNYIPSYSGLHIISVTNMWQECGDPTTRFTFYSIRKVGLYATPNNNILNVVIYLKESDDNPQYGQLLLNNDDKYTLELWHSMYGQMKTKVVLSSNEQIDINNLPQGVYVLLLKENGNIIAQTKVQI